MERDDDNANGSDDNAHNARDLRTISELRAKVARLTIALTTAVHGLRSAIVLLDNVDGSRSRKTAGQHMWKSLVRRQRIRLGRAAAALAAETNRTPDDVLGT